MIPCLFRNMLSKELSHCVPSKTLTDLDETASGTFEKRGQTQGGDVGLWNIMVGPSRERAIGWASARTRKREKEADVRAARRSDFGVSSIQSQSSGSDMCGNSSSVSSLFLLTCMARCRIAYQSLFNPLHNGCVVLCYVQYCCAASITFGIGDLC